MSTYRHTGSIYRRRPTGADANGKATFAWDLVLAGVAARGQPTVSPPVAQQELGRVSAAEFFFVFASGTDLGTDDGFKVTSSWLASMVGRKLLVARPPEDFGSGGGLQVDMVETQEAFG